MIMVTLKCCDDVSKIQKIVQSDWMWALLIGGIGIWLFSAIHTWRWTKKRLRRVETAESKLRTDDCDLQKREDIAKEREKKVDEILAKISTMLDNKK